MPDTSSLSYETTQISREKLPNKYINWSTEDNSDSQREKPMLLTQLIKKCWTNEICSTNQAIWYVGQQQFNNMSVSIHIYWNVSSWKLTAIKRREHVLKTLDFYCLFDITEEHCCWFVERGEGDYGIYCRLLRCENVHKLPTCLRFILLLQVHTFLNESTLVSAAWSIFLYGTNNNASTHVILISLNK